MSDEPAFDDADELLDDASDEDLAKTVASMIQADLGGAAPGAVERALRAASPAARVRIAAAWTDAMERGGLRAWIEEDRERRRKAEALVLRVAPADPGAQENGAALAEARAFEGWGEHPFGALIVPGYTAVNARAEPGVSEIGQRRLVEAERAFRDGLAPFVVLSGGNVHPRGTPYHEAIEMKTALLAMGVPAARVIVDARARHSTTNLRNAGRILRAQGIARGLVVTLGGGVFGSDLFGQDFYFANAWLSTFLGRCRSELGYDVGELEEIAPHRIAFTPSAEVTRVGFHDALDP